MIKFVTGHPGALGPSGHGARPHEGPSSPGAKAGAEDWLTAGVLFAIIGGCAALWLFDLSLIPGAVAASFSAVAGVLFANG